MAGEQHRHDISDRAWEKIKPYTLGEKGTRGGNARDTQQFINSSGKLRRASASSLAVISFPAIKKDCSASSFAKYLCRYKGSRYY